MNPQIARERMIEQQVRAWDVLDPRVLAVMERIPRERFVPERYRGLAFADTEVPLPHGECMMAPKVEGRLLQALDLSGADTVLEIGTGSGYLTACLAALAARVSSIDIHEDFVTGAAQRLRGMDLTNAETSAMDATETLPGGKFDAVALTASLPCYDPRYAEILAPGGRLFAVIGEPPIMEARLVTRTGPEEWRQSVLFETLLPPLRNARRPQSFVF